MNEAIQKIKEQMLTQDNRATSYSIFIVVEDKKVYGVEPSIGGKERKDSDYFELDDLCNSCAELYENQEALPEDCDNYDCENSFIHYRIEKDVPNMRAAFFFTAEACDKHIEANGHHYNSTAKSYAISAYHNPELRIVMEYIVGKDLR